MRPLVSKTLIPWRGLIVSDCSELFNCEYPPVPINSIRTRVVRTRLVTRNVEGALAGVEAAGGGENAADAEQLGETAAAASVATGVTAGSAAAPVAATAPATGLPEGAAAAAGGAATGPLSPGDEGARRRSRRRRGGGTAPTTAAARVLS